MTLLKKCSKAQLKLTEVLVTYRCWGCGSEKITLEDIDLTLPVAEIEQWNLCGECIKRNEKNKDKAGK